MKFLVVSITLFVFATGASVNLHQEHHDEFLEQVHQSHKKCLEDPEIHVDDVYSNSYRKGEEVDLNHFIKLAPCMIQQWGFLTENGEIDLDKLATKYGKHRADFFEKKCLKKNDDKKQEVLHFWHCFLQFRRHRDGEFDL